MADLPRDEKGQPTGGTPASAAGVTLIVAEGEHALSPAASAHSAAPTQKTAEDREVQLPVKPAPQEDASKKSIKRSSLASSFEHETREKAYNWRAGAYPPPPKGASPFWMSQLLKIAIGSFFILASAIIAFIVYQESLSKKAAKNLSKLATQLATPMPFEAMFWIFRLLFALGVGLFVYGAVKAAIYAVAPGVTFIVHRFGGRDRDVPRRVRAAVDRLFALRGYIAFTLTAFTEIFVADALFPILKEHDFSIFTKIDPKAAAGVADAHAVSLVNLASVVTGSDYDRQRMLNRIVYCVFAGSTIVLLEKILMQVIASGFHKRTFGQRIEDIRVVRKTGRRLKAAIVESSGGTISARQATGTIIAQGCLQGSTSPDGTFGVEELERYLPPADAAAFAALVNLNGTGRWTESEMLEAINYWEKEEEHVRLGVSGSIDIIAKLDRVLLVLCVPLIAFCVLALLNVSISTITTAIAGLTALIFAMTNKTIVDFFHSIIFVIFTHPFDVGDKVVIRGTTYRVRELGLWTCTFLGPGSRITYYRNSELASAEISNVRRSGAQSESASVFVLASTPREALTQLEARMQEFVKRMPRDFAPDTYIDSVRIDDANAMEVEFDVSHRTNFQDGTAKARRTTKYLLAMRDAIMDLGIKLRPSDVVIRS